ncbi:hypothetical protein ABTY61_03775 [Kitasatospora sp. NPDC096128]|uniref:hypothetical protein n=1 Tax=Kitasatospora sp. NPDC096128 TaxID=3155547 RepID=UPI0033214993
MTVPPQSSYAPRSRPGGGSRANAVAVLLLAGGAVGSLALPWASYSGESGGLEWSGFDLLNSPRWVGELTNGADIWMGALQWVGLALVALSVLRLLTREVRLAGLGLLLAVGVAGAAIGSLVQFHKLLQDAGAFAPSMQAGPIVAAVAAVLCFLVACFGPATEHR